jgi:hypothetical protein
MATWKPDPAVVPLLNALRKSEQRHDRKLVNAARGRDADGRAPFFPSLEPGSRGFVSQLGGQAKPAEQAKRR